MLTKTEVAALTSMTTLELVALHNIGVMSTKCLRVGETERADAIHEVTLTELAARGIETVEGKLLERVAA